MKFRTHLNLRIDTEILCYDWAAVSVLWLQTAHGTKRRGENVVMKGIGFFKGVMGYINKDVCLDEPPSKFICPKGNGLIIERVKQEFLWGIYFYHIK